MELKSNVCFTLRKILKVVGGFQGVFCLRGKIPALLPKYFLTKKLLALRSKHHRRWSAS